MPVRAVGDAVGVRASAPPCFDALAVWRMIPINDEMPFRAVGDAVGFWESADPVSWILGCNADSLIRGAIGHR